jgi:hypothetical protein
MLSSNGQTDELQKDLYSEATRGVVGGKKSENIQRSYVMNTTLSQNVIVITYNGMLPTNKTERAQL